MKVLLLVGGWSSEREISLRGGDQIAAALIERGHTVTFFDPAREFDHLMEAARQHDVAFIALHGAPGEDGLMQALLDRAGCPYQGTGPAGSFLALHKAAARQIFRDAGLCISEGLFLPHHPGHGWISALPFPLFVKSNTGGSSLNMARVTTQKELDTALDTLFAAGVEVLIERCIAGRDVTCGVLDDRALDPILILSKDGFFDYHNKYAADGAQELCPAPLPEDILTRIREDALRAHQALGLQGYSRADFMLQDDGTLVLLEVNTIPGMTAASLVPKEAAVIGMSFADLVEKLLAMALRDHQKIPVGERSV